MLGVVKMSLVFAVAFSLLFAELAVGVRVVSSGTCVDLTVKFSLNWNVW